MVTTVTCPLYWPLIGLIGLLPSPRLSAVLGVASFTYLEVLVTTARARGRGVASGIVTEIQSEDNIVT